MTCTNEFSIAKKNAFQVFKQLILCYNHEFKKKLKTYSVHQQHI